MGQGHPVTVRAGHRASAVGAGPFSSQKGSSLQPVPSQGTSIPEMHIGFFPRNLLWALVANLGSAPLGKHPNLSPSFFIIKMGKRILLHVLA